MLAFDLTIPVRIPFESTVSSVKLFDQRMIIRLVHFYKKKIVIEVVRATVTLTLLHYATTLFIELHRTVTAVGRLT